MQGKNCSPRGKNCSPRGIILLLVLSLSSFLIFPFFLYFFLSPSLPFLRIFFSNFPTFLHTIYSGLFKNSVNISTAQGFMKICIQFILYPRWQTVTLPHPQQSKQLFTHKSKFLNGRVRHDLNPAEKFDPSSTEMSHALWKGGLI